MILIRPAETGTEPDPRLGRDWTGTEVLLSPSAAPDRWAAAVRTAATHRLPLVMPHVARDQLGAVVVRLARLAPDLGLAAVVITHGHDPCTARACFTPLSWRQRLRPARRPRRPF